MRRFWILLWVIGCVLALAGCNRAGARIPGASLPFPQTPVHFVSPSPSPLSIWIEPPRDLRSQHYGEPVAGTRWKACKTDPFWLTSAPSIVAEHVRSELEASRVFANVSVSPEGRASELHLSTEIHAFCSQAVGFLFLRVAGLTSLRFTIQRGSEILFDKKYRARRHRRGSGVFRDAGRNDRADHATHHGGQLPRSAARIHSRARDACFRMEVGRRHCAEGKR